MKIIGLLGYKGCGKNTVAEYLTNYSYSVYSLAEPLKNVCKELFNMSEEDVSSGKNNMNKLWGVPNRELLQIVGTDAFRNYLPTINPIFKNFWIKNLSNRIKHEKRVVISDCRFQDECDYIKNLGGITITIIRPSLETNDKHESETSYKNIDVDEYLFNDGDLDKLYTNVDELMLKYDV